MKRLINEPRRLLTFLAVSVGIVFAAIAEVSFSASKYDFGRLREEAGPVTGRVTMTNLGPGPTYIKNVRTTCGCTGATFTEGMIEEGDSAVISFTYDPEGRPGFFDKSVKVFVGQDNKMHIIRISGLVMASESTIAANYPDSIGELRLSTLLIDGKEIKKGESRSYFVQLYNPTERTIRPVAKSSSEALSIAVEPAEIEPGATGVLGIYLNTRREPVSGEKDYDIEICSDADASVSDMGTVKIHSLINER